MLYSTSLARIWHNTWQIILIVNHKKERRWKLHSHSFLPVKRDCFMYIALFVLGIVIFGYLMYYLLDPKSFKLHN